MGGAPGAGAAPSAHGTAGRASVGGTAGAHMRGGSMNIRSAQMNGAPQAANPDGNWRGNRMNGGNWNGGRVAVTGGNGNWSGGQVAGNNWNGRGENWNRARRFDRGPGFAFGFGAGSGYYGGYANNGYPYDNTYAYYNNPNYSDTFAYDDEPSVGIAVTPGADDPSYCVQRFRSYDPASGTYLGYDGMRHPCP